MAEIVTKADLRDAFERQSLALTIRLGTISAAIGAVIITVLGFLLRSH